MELGTGAAFVGDQTGKGSFVTANGETNDSTESRFPYVDTEVLSAGVCIAFQGTQRAISTAMCCCGLFYKGVLVSVP